MKRRDTFDYYDPRQDDVYGNENMYYYDDVRDPREQQKFNGTMEFTSVKGHGLDINSRPWGEETMIFGRPQLEHSYPSMNANSMNNPYFQNQNPYNTQQINVSSLHQQYPQKPFNTQQINANLNPQSQYGQFQQPNIGSTQQLSFGNNSYITPLHQNPYEIGVVNSSNTATTEPAGPNPFNTKETQELIKTSLQKQSEINRASFEKQMETSQRTEELQKQVDELTQTLANVTNNFGKAMSNLSNNLKTTQDLLKSQTQTLSFKNEYPDERINVVSTKKQQSNPNDESDLPTSKTQSNSIVFDSELLKPTKENNVQKSANQTKTNNNLKYLNNVPYVTNAQDFNADNINPVKEKENKKDKREKGKKKLISRPWFITLLVFFILVIVGVAVFLGLLFGGIIK